MLVRSATPDDAERLSALAIQVWLHTYATEGISSTISSYVLSQFSTDRFTSLLLTQESKVLVAEVAENLVGFATVSFGTVCPKPATARAELATLYVQEHFHGNGVGRQLLREAESLALLNAGSSLWLTVNSKNHRAIDFYFKNGYKKIGTTYFSLGEEKHENLVLSNPAA